MNPSLSELIRLSRLFGADFRLVWKGGGNISVKTDDGNMFIKASGTELGRMNRKEGWRKVDLKKVRRLLDNLLNHWSSPGKIKKGLLKTCCDGLVDAPMPSIETFFHALLGRCVIHLHPMAVLPFLCSQNGQRHLREILSPEFVFHWIDFRGLGVVTAGQILGQVKKKKLNLSAPHIFFLSNHGLIISCNSPRQAKQVLNQIIKHCDDQLLPVRPVSATQKHKLTKTASVIHSVFLSLCDFAESRFTFPIESLQTPNGLMPKKEWFSGIITPEELTCLGGGIVWLEKDIPNTLKRNIAGHFRKTGLWPGAFFVAGKGLFISDIKQNLELMKKVYLNYLQIRGQAMRMGGLKPLARKYLTGEGL